VLILCLHYCLCICVFGCFRCFSFFFVASPSVLWYCCLGLLTCKNRLPYNLYCVGGEVKHCSLACGLHRYVLSRRWQRPRRGWSFMSWTYGKTTCCLSLNSREKSSSQLTTCLFHISSSLQLFFLLSWAGQWHQLNAVLFMSCYIFIL